MRIDSKPRDFSYIYHKDNYPLQLNGTMKRRSRPQSSQNIKNNSTDPQNNCNKSILSAKRIIDNYQDLKSVLPYDLEKSKKQSHKKTFDKQRCVNISGAAYLMIKSKGQTDHPEKRHLNEWNIPSRYNNYSAKKQKRHYCHVNAQSVQKQKEQPKKHLQTLNYRLENDIYSNIEVKQNIVDSSVKINKRNMFVEGKVLGYDKQKESKISCAKMKQIQGAYNIPEPRNSRVYRNQWRVSNIDFA